ncbi:TPA: hypothetical protein PXM79_004094 [Yersinia enterocolitica]|nr:hypothetical protein [Yersinia enterocolitica]
MSKFKCRLINLLCFFFGIVVTVIVLWILYKDPTRITAPALAALTAMCTFLLALCSALKVDEWLKNKINDSAYKQTVSIMDDITKLMISNEMIRKNIYSYQGINKKGHCNEDIKKQKEKLLKYNTEIISLHESMNIKIKMLNHWNAKTTTEFDKVLVEINRSIKDVNHCIEESCSNVHFLESISNEIEKLNTMKSAMEIISNMTNKELFHPIG